MKQFELPAKKKIKDFSKGMKVKLAFAVALSHKAELLILDEATSGLDPIIRDDILDILIDFVQDENYSILFSSHITSDLEKIADYITFIHKGRLVFCSLKDDLIDNYGVVSCGASVFDTLDKTEIISYQKEDYQYKVDMQGYGIRITTKGVFGTTVEKPKVAVCPKCGEVSLYIENFKSIK